MDAFDAIRAVLCSGSSGSGCHWPPVSVTKEPFPAVPTMASTVATQVRPLPATINSLSPGAACPSVAAPHCRSRSDPAPRYTGQGCARATLSGRMVSPRRGCSTFGTSRAGSRARIHAKRSCTPHAQRTSWRRSRGGRGAPPHAGHFSRGCGAGTEVAWGVVEQGHRTLPAAHEINHSPGGDGRGRTRHPAQVMLRRPQYVQIAPLVRHCVSPVSRQHPPRCSCRCSTVPPSTSMG